MLKCVMIIVWCHHRHSGDVICIQGRDLSTNHLWFCLSKTKFLSVVFVKLCYYSCLMPTPTVEMSYAYKDEIWVQIICDSFHPKPNFCQCYCQNVSLLLFDAITDIVEMSYAYKDEIGVQIICDSVYPKPYYSPPRMSKCVIITVWCQNRQWRCHMHNFKTSPTVK